MKKADKRLIELLTKKATGSISTAEKKELQKLLNAQKSDNGQSIKADKEKHVKLMQKVENQCNNVIREAVKRVLEIHADAGCELDKKDISLSYKGKADKSVTKKNISLSIRTRIKRKPIGKSKKAIEQNAVRNEMQNILS
tara:strand:- start:229 stop:648 length:420 start_codon:yes stop_codon:yes gene_type:complete